MDKPELKLNFYSRAEAINQYRLPLAESRISAGFPSPADDHFEGKLDLNEHLISHPAATFFVRVSGQSMLNAGIRDGDLLIVDRALQADHNTICICLLEGEFTVKRLALRDGRIFLIPENPDYEPLSITEFDHFEVWGVVTYIISKAR